MVSTEKPERQKRTGCRGVAPLLIVALLTCYVLSYAPYIRWRWEGPTPVSSGFMGQHYDYEATLPPAPTVYRPVDWLIDNTPLDRPLRWWAEQWGVREYFQVTQMLRFLDREYASTLND